MTVPDYTHMRDLRFNDWVRKKLPDSRTTGTRITDVDFVIFNPYDKRIFILEEKKKNKSPKPWQKYIFYLLDKWIRKGIDKDWRYKGFHTVTFENTFFDNGDCYFNRKLVTEEQLIRILTNFLEE